MRHSIGKLVGLAAARWSGLGTWARSRWRGCANECPGSTIGQARSAPAGGAGRQHHHVDAPVQLARGRRRHGDRLGDRVPAVSGGAFVPEPRLEVGPAIGLTSVGSRVYAKFDSVQSAASVPYRRASIKMSREEARNLEPAPRATPGRLTRDRSAGHRACMEANDSCEFWSSRTTRTSPRFIRNGLAQAGCNVDHADNGKDGLFLATTETYDALVVDRMLPASTGSR